MKLKIIKVDKGLERMGFKKGDIYEAYDWMREGYPYVICPTGNTTMLMPKDYEIINIENK